MQLTPGLQVGPYEVMAVLGTGGMAEVYRARDTRLGREVALKVVKAPMAANPELLERLEKEARIAGSLNHPNLVTVYDVGQHDGTPYFVTELLEGESLRSRLSRGRVPVRTALEWGAQLARGLAAAHARGIVHRDVKPDNIFVTGDGQVKLLDFGIAKLSEVQNPGGAHGLMDATVTPGGAATTPGAVLGTPGYMSPEQVRGEALDARSDVFSLGTVLHELLGGGRAFPGESLVDTGYAIVHHDPAPLPPELPPSVGPVVLRCLEKEPGRRFQSASDLAFALDMLRGSTRSERLELPPHRGVRRRWLLAAAALGIAVIAGGAGALLSRSRTPARSWPTMEQVTKRWGSIQAARFGPDGRILFSAAFEGAPEEIYAQPRGSLAAQTLGLANSRLASVSSTGEVALLLDPRRSMIRTVRGTLARVPGVGGTPREIAENVEWADWSPTGELAVVMGGDTTRTLEYPRGKTLFQTTGWVSNPRFSRSGDRIAFIHHPVLGDDMGEITSVDLQGQTKVLSGRLPTTVGLAWGGDREIWFTAGQAKIDTIHAVDLDGRRREIYRAPVDIHLDDVAPDGSVLLTSRFDRTDVVHVSASGQQRFMSWSEWNYDVGALSRDKILFSVTDPTPTAAGLQGSLALLRKLDGSPAQILAEGAADDLSGDGRWALVRSGDGRALQAIPTGPGQPRRFDLGDLEVRSARWLPDGRGVLVAARNPSSPAHRLFMLGREDARPRLVSEAPVSSRAFLSVSPSGRSVASVNPEGEILVISTSDGSAAPIRGIGPGVFPSGWASESQLWLSRTAERPPAQTTLIRVEVSSGRQLEARTVGPVEPSGTIALGRVAIGPDGRELAFSFNRTLGSLYLLKGLEGR
ncbi:MAG TPA: protein kinase [Myxococcaceae bacterium]|nr:protein kinase [Myxococcaceae bacterium]